ncbi:hypothetical protein BDN70DRAFT_901493 [Pholiota conissans]|uniref:Uncharacterized protein n=1 Tax=Pholiota conissans TaxID=109636 RepID=A0A9P5YNW1_9AGAR|nr:hypothetical protein BDN70DRAFT_901493 [Pholiota conissans]
MEMLQYWKTSIRERNSSMRTKLYNMAARTVRKALWVFCPGAEVIAKDGRGEMFLATFMVTWRRGCFFDGWVSGLMLYPAVGAGSVGRGFNAQGFFLAVARDERGFWVQKKRGMSRGIYLDFLNPFVGQREGWVGWMQQMPFG